MNQITVRCRRCKHIGPIPATGFCDGRHSLHPCEATPCPVCGVAHAWEPLARILGSEARARVVARLTLEEWRTSDRLLRQVFGGGA